MLMFLSPMIDQLHGCLILKTSSPHHCFTQAAKSLSVQFAAKNEEMEKGEWPLADFEKKEQ